MVCEALAIGKLCNSYEGIYIYICTICIHMYSACIYINIYIDVHTYIYIHSRIIIYQVM